MNAADIALIVLCVGIIAPIIVGLWIALYCIIKEIREELNPK